jgi:hypothetical protein
MANLATVKRRDAGGRTGKWIVNVVGCFLITLIVESRRGIERAVRDALRGAADAAVAASARAGRLHARGRAAVAEEAERLRGLRAELTSLLAT